MATLEEVLAGQLGPVPVRFRYELRTINNLFFVDISNAIVDESCTVRLNNENLTVWTVAFEVNAPVLLEIMTEALDPEVVTLNTIINSLNSADLCFAPFYDVLVDGTYVEHQCGLYRLTQPRRSIDPNTGRERWAVRGNDLGDVLERASDANWYIVPIAGDYITNVEALLSSVGAAHDIVVNPTATAEVLLAWPPATSKREIVNNLLFGANYFNIYPSNEGVFTSQRKLYNGGAGSGGLETMVHPVAVTYSANVEPRMVEASDVGLEYNDVQYDNEARLQRIDPHYANLDIVIVSNSDANSSISSASIGQDIIWKPNIDFITDDNVLLGGGINGRDEVGTYHVLEQDSLVEQLTVSTFPDPRRGAHEFYTLDIPGVPDAAGWRVLSWELPLKVGGRMMHRLARCEERDLGHALLIS